MCAAAEFFEAYLALWRAQDVIDGRVKFACSSISAVSVALKDSKMPYLARFTRSGHDIFIYGTKVPSFYRSFGRTLCGDAHVGHKRPPQHDGEERSARNDKEKISRPSSRDILIKAEMTLF